MSLMTVLSHIVLFLPLVIGVIFFLLCIEWNPPTGERKQQAALVWALLAACVALQIAILILTEEVQ